MIYLDAFKGKEKLSALGFGTAPIGISGYIDSSYQQATNEEKSIRLLEYAFEQGINFFDTAPAYANKVSDNGWSTDRASEKMLGKLVRKVARDKIFIATKNHLDDYSSAGISKSIDESLRILNTDYIDLFQIHGLAKKPYRSSEISEIVNEDSIEALFKARDAGKIRYLGISGYREDALCTAIDTGWFDAVMPLFNIFNRQAEIELTQLCERHGVSIFPMRPLGAGSVQELSDYLPGNKQENINSIIKFAMEYLLRFKAIGSIPIGMRYHDELESNIRILSEVSS